MHKSTVYTILGIVAMEPMSGYQIKKTINETTGFFWAESPGQIYPSLKAAHKDGLLEIIEHANQRKSTKYKITAQGKAALQDWLLIQPSKLTQRNELMLKVFFGNNTQPEIILDYIKESRISLNAKLRHYEQLEARIKDYIKFKYPGAHYWHVTIQYGLAMVNAAIAWCDSTLEYLSDIKA